MYAKVYSVVVIGIDTIKIDIEVDAVNGLPNEQIVGLPDKAIRESKNRIKSAIRNSGFNYPLKSIIINLSPADIQKEGSLYDLPIAVAILKATGQLSLSDSFLIVGELGLDGYIKSIQGTVSIADFINNSNYENLIIPKDNFSETRYFSNIKVFPIQHLSEISNLICKSHHIIQTSESKSFSPVNIDFEEVSGQTLAKKALEIAVVGKHNMLFSGSPGCGKTMLMKRIPSILPALSKNKAIECLKIHCLTKHKDTSVDLSYHPPFLSPHHSTSLIGLVGGGKRPMPGIISQCHNGVLFLDEFPEFSKQAIEALRQPLEDKIITISRSQYTLTFPASFQLVLCMNPCPCGYLHHEYVDCQCSSTMIKRYRQKISGPILDRIDMVLHLKQNCSHNLDSKASQLSSKVMKNNIVQALEFKKSRMNFDQKNIHSINKLSEIGQVSSSAKELIKQFLDSHQMSSRSLNSLLKISRSIADLKQQVNITESSVLEAYQFKNNLGTNSF